MGVVVLMTSTLNALVVLAYTIFCICFHWGEVNWGLLYMYAFYSFINSGAWIATAVLAGVDFMRGHRVADDGMSDATSV